MDYELIFDMIRFAGGGCTAYTLTRQYCAKTREHVDWHKIGNYLDALQTRGIIRVIGMDDDGMTVYKLRDTIDGAPAA